MRAPAGLVALLVACLALMMLPGTASAADWFPRGGALNVQPASSYYPDIAMDGTVPVATVDNGSDLFVRRWNGTGWTTLGGAPVNNFQAFDNSIAVGGGSIYLAWSQLQSVEKVYVSRWTGSAWSPVGAEVQEQANNRSGQPDIEVIGGVPYVVLEDTDAGSPVPEGLRVRRWDGASWSTVGGTGTFLNADLTGAVGQAALAGSSATELYVVYAEPVGGVRTALVKHWNGVSWQTLGGQLNTVGSTAGGCTCYDVAFDGARPIVSYVEVVGGSNVAFVKRWNGSSWEQMGAGMPGVPDLTVDGATPYVSVLDAGKLRVYRWNGGAWIGLGSSLNSDPSKTASGPPRIAAVSGVPYAAYREPDGAGILTTYVKYWDPLASRGVLVPGADRSAPTEWHRTDGACAVVTSALYSVLDEPFEVPNSTACGSGTPGDVMQTATAPVAPSASLELTDSGGDVATVQELRIRSRGWKNGGKTGSLRVEVRLADGTSPGAAVTHTLGDTTFPFDYTLTGLSLTKAQVDGIYLVVTGTVTGGGSATSLHVTTLDVETKYVPRDVTISGRALAPGGGAPWAQCDGITPNVAISVAGATKLAAPCSAATGDYLFTTPLGSADVSVAGFLDPVTPGDRGATYTRTANAAGDIAGLDIVMGTVTFRSEPGAVLTNGSVAEFDQTLDADIPVDSTATGLTVNAGYELHVPAGSTWAPGGATTTPSLRLAGTLLGAAGDLLTLNAAGTGSCTAGVGVMRPLCRETGSTLSAAGMTVRFTGAGDSHVDGGTYGSLELVPAGGSPVYALGSGPQASVTASGLVVGNAAVPVVASTTQFSPAITVNGPLEVRDAATLGGSGAGSIRVAGSVTGSGAVSLSGGSFEQRPADGTVEFGSTGGSLPWQFSTLAFGNAASGAATIRLAAGGTGAIRAAVTLDVGGVADTGTTMLDADTNDRVLDIDGHLQVRTSGTLSASSTAQFTLAGDLSVAGTWVANTGTLTIDDASKVSTIAQTTLTTVHHLSIQVAGKQVRFDETDTLRVTGTFTADGGSCATPVTLTSSTAGDAFLLDLPGAAAVRYASLRDSAVTPARTTTDSIDDGGNSGWTFTNPCAAPSVTLSLTTYAADGSGPFGSPATTALGSMVPGETRVGEVRASVTASNASGYQLLLADPDAGGAMEHATAGAVPWLSAGSVAAPGPWSGSGAAVSVYGGAETPARWCTGGQANCTSNDDPELLWAPLTGTSQQVSGSSAAITGDVSRIMIRVQLPAAQSPGAYAGQMSVTAVANV